MAEISAEDFQNDAQVRARASVDDKDKELLPRGILVNHISICISQLVKKLSVILKG